MRGHVRKRGKSSWALVIDLGRDANGKRRQKWHSFKGTKKGAEAEITRLLESMRTGTYVEPQRLTVNDLLERWLSSRESKVGARTLAVYREIVKKHLAPALGALRLEKLQPFHLDEYYEKKLREGRSDGKGGLAPASVAKHHRILHAAFETALRWNWLSHNPSDRADPPTPEGREMASLDEAGIGKLLEAAANSELHVPVLLAVTTGLRRGEFLALRWSDLNGNRLTICRALEQTGEGLTFKTPKTEKSARTIALPAFVVEELRRHKAVQAQVRLQIGPHYADEGLVFCRPDGSPLSPGGFSIAFRRLVRSAGLKLRLHDLRHSHATHLLALGIHPKVVSERLGHSRVAFTLDVYSHVLEGMQDEAAAKVDAALGSSFRRSGL